MSENLKIRDIILNTNEPLIIHKFCTNWKVFDGSLEDWCQKYDDNKTNTTFEQMTVLFSDCCWEKYRTGIKMSTKEFLKLHQTLPEDEPNYWSALQYQRTHDMPPEIIKGVDFSCFGFPNTAEDVNFWMGSKNSNTPCHYDTYGCNIVVQVYGSKSWLLFPPDAPLSPTRIPYEESSVYCLENFYCPSENDAKSCDAIKSYARHCILEPGDVLIIPKHWWHFVEAMEVSLSVNCWIPLANDREDQLDECIVKYLMEKLVGKNSEEVMKYFLNPNQLNQMAEDQELIGILEHLLKKKLKESIKKEEIHSEPPYSYQYLNEQELEELLKKSKSKFTIVPKMSHKNFEDLLKKNSKRHKESCKEILNRHAMHSIFFNSICSPKVIKQISMEFKNKYQRFFQEDVEK